MKPLIFATLLAVAPLAAAAESARDIVLGGLDAVFVNPDAEAINLYFAEDYIQHNPAFPNGLDTLRGFASGSAAGINYQIGNVVADEENGMVAVHFRVTGFGPKPFVGVDIFRVTDGKITEHWDVLQEEVAETVSGNPMWSPPAE